MFTTRRVLSGAALFAAGLTVAGLSARGHPSQPLLYDVAGVEQSVTADEVATWIIEGRRDFTVIDLRPPADFERGHIRAAVNCHHCHIDRKGADAEEGYYVDLSKKLVAYTETGAEHMKLPRIVARHPNLMLVKGGWQAWKTDVLGPVSFEGVDDDEARAELLRREARRAFFAGERTGPGAAAAPAVVPLKRECPRPAPATAREGC